MNFNNPNSNNSNNSNINIAELISQSQNLDNNIRKPAEQRLQYLEEQNFSRFILELCKVLVNANLSSEIRTGAGLSLKNCIGGARSADKLAKIRKRWQMQEPSTRNEIKSAILSVLQHDDRDSRKTAVNIISNLASVETLSEWKQLMPTLINSALSKNKELKHSSLSAIGQIAEDSNTHDDLQEFVAKLLECVAQGMSSEDMSVQSEAMKCLSSILELVAPNMQIDRECRIILQMVCAGANNMKNKDLRLNSFMCVCRMVEYYYDLLKPYMSDIFKISKQCIERGVALKEDGDVCKQAIEIWSCCAEIEADIEMEKEENPKCERQNHGFINRALQLLVPIYLKALCLQKEEYDEDEWTIRKASAVSLELFAIIAKNNILQYVLQFVESNISQKTWRRREAALCAFGSCLEGPEEEKLVRLVSQICPIILQLMSDDNVQVRATATWVFGRICDIVPDSVGNTEILGPIVNALNDRDGIANKACWCIASLTKFYSEKNVPGACIYANDNAFNLIRELLKRGARSNSSGRLIISAHEALNAIIFYMPQSEAYTAMLKSLLPELVNQMMSCAQQTKSDNSDFTMHKMAGLFSTVQVAISRLGMDCLNEQTTNKIMQCCCLLLQKEHALVYEEALGCMTHVSQCIGDKFATYLCADNIKELLLKSIKIGASNDQICKIGTGCIGDAYRACTQFFQNSDNILRLQSYTDLVVSELLTILINTRMDISLKPHVIDALNDILISHGSSATRYSADILDKCLLIGVMKPPQDIDDDVAITFNEIRCSIIDTCRTCLAELAASNMINNFAQYIPKLNEFFKAIASDERVNLEVVRSCVHLLEEASDYCDNTMKSKLRTDVVTSILKQAGQQKQDQQLSEMAITVFKRLNGQN